jgi:hypothetical protein
MMSGGVPNHPPPHPSLHHPGGGFPGPFMHPLGANGGFGSAAFPHHHPHHHHHFLPAFKSERDADQGKEQEYNSTGYEAQIFISVTNSNTLL